MSGPILVQDMPGETDDDKLDAALALARERAEAGEPQPWIAVSGTFERVRVPTPGRGGPSEGAR